MEDKMTYTQARELLTVAKSEEIPEALSVQMRQTIMQRSGDIVDALIREDNKTLGIMVVGIGMMAIGAIVGFIGLQYKLPFWAGYVDGSALASGTGVISAAYAKSKQIKGMLQDMHQFLEIR